MSLKCGIVGLPNVGKSTLFNALTKAGIAAENYPFCTIEPNADLATVETAQSRVARQAQSGDKEARKLDAILTRVRAHLDQGRPVRSLALEGEALELIRPLCLLAAKPAIYVANVDEHGFENNVLLEQVRAYAAHENAPVVAICASLEAEIADLSDFERGFIRAEVIAFDDFVKYGGEQGAKEAGKMRLEGKDYVVRDGDVIYFRFNV